MMDQGIYVGLGGKWGHIEREGWGRGERIVGLQVPVRHKIRLGILEKNGKIGASVWGIGYLKLRLWWDCNFGLWHDLVMILGVSF